MHAMVSEIRSGSNQGRLKINECDKKANHARMQNWNPIYVIWIPRQFELLSFLYSVRPLPQNISTISFFCFDFFTSTLCFSQQVAANSGALKGREKSIKESIWLFRKPFRPLYAAKAVSVCKRRHLTVQCLEPEEEQQPTNRPEQLRQLPAPPTRPVTAGTERPRPSSPWTSDWLTPERSVEMPFCKKRSNVSAHTECVSGSPCLEKTPLPLTLCCF